MVVKLRARHILHLRMIVLRKFSPFREIVSLGRLLARELGDILARQGREEGHKWTDKRLRVYKALMRRGKTSEETAIRSLLCSETVLRPGQELSIRHVQPRAGRLFRGEKIFFTKSDTATYCILGIFAETHMSSPSPAVLSVHAFIGDDQPTDLSDDHAQSAACAACCTSVYFKLESITEHTRPSLCPSFVPLPLNPAATFSLSPRREFSPQCLTRNTCCDGGGTTPRAWRL